MNPPSSTATPLWWRTVGQELRLFFVAKNISPGELKLSLLGAFRTKGGQDFAIDVKDLDARNYITPVNSDDCCPHLKSMIVRVGNDDTICVADGDIMWMLKLSGLAAHRAKLGHESAVALENLTRKKVGRRTWSRQSTKNYDYGMRDISKEDKDLDPVVFFVAYVDESQ